MSSPAGHSTLTWAGLHCHRLALPNGDSVVVAERGAQVLSWVSAGQERLFLSPPELFDGVAAIRGGIPVCWPQFNQRGPLPKHGLARRADWQWQGFTPLADGVRACLAWSGDAAAALFWPQSFDLQLALELRPQRLKVVLHVRNTSATALAFTGALHTYLAVHDIAHTVLTGLAGLPEWNAVQDTHGTAAAELHFQGEFDRVYTAPASGEMALYDGAQTLALHHSPEWGQVVVWNPGAAKATALADMPPDAHRRMLCVEAAQVDSSILLAPGQAWAGAQELMVRQ